MANTTHSAFLQRARLEAERYGSDPWVFVRELLQNARDAGAHRVWFESSSVDGRERISCRDDGSGMSFEHAQRYLFSLYASSKRGRLRTAGQFGIGFWSVLRFDPTEIVVRSRPIRGQGWQLQLDGRLETIRRESTSALQGTEVVLERPGAGSDLERMVKESILRDAPFLRCRHRAEHPLDVRVNGDRVRSEPGLPPPSVTFRRRGVRGVVGLGVEARAEVFAHGLRVREAATLDELLVERQARGSALTGTAGGLAPRVIIDSRELEVLMARGDAREDRALQRLVAVGQRELSRLVRGELDRHAHLSTSARLLSRMRELLASAPFARVSALVVLGLSLVLAGLWFFPERMPLKAGQSEMPLESTEDSSAGATAYRDLWQSYRGPEVDELGSAGPALDLSYRPAESSQLFAAVWVTGLNDDGLPDSSQAEVIGRYEGAPCGSSCLEVVLRVDAPRGLLRLPIATGHVLDPDDVRLDDDLLPVVSVSTGQPAVWLDRPRRGRMRYRSAPGVSDSMAGENRWPTLPREFDEFARDFDAVPPSSLALETAVFVSRHVVYDTSPETVARHRQARERSMRLFDRAAAIGAGDCDVQNSLVAAMLDRADVPSRLAVGWIADGGRAISGLHAWTEYRGDDGRWRAVDASAVGEPDRWSPGPSLAVETRAPRPRLSLLLWFVAAVVVVLAIAVPAAVLGARQWRRSVQAGNEDDVVGLVRGAAVRPHAFAGIHSLFTRRLLPLLSNRSISLSRARAKANKGQLACGSRRSELARRAARGGGVVLDLERPESAVVADALVAVDLDRWQELLDRAESDQLMTDVEARLKVDGEHLRFRVAGRVGVEVAVLDGDALGLGSNDRWVVIDEKSRTWKSIVHVGEKWPARAALLLADNVLNRTCVPPATRRRCLSRLASAAMFEAVGGTR